MNWTMLRIAQIGMMDTRIEDMVVSKRKLASIL